jgi:hypothetical protein
METATRFRFKNLLLVFVGVMALGTFGFMAAEGVSLTDAIYFCIVTITTVGYGDIHPDTGAGKALALVLIVTGVGTFMGVVAVVTDSILSRREKQMRLQKLHLVIGVFFSEVGTKLLECFSDADRGLDGARENLLVTGGWSDRNFSESSTRLKDYESDLDASKIDLEFIRGFLRDRSDLLMRLLENPYSLEREAFTDLLRAVFHLREELIHREDLSGLPDSDRAHLTGDMKRAYLLLIGQWLDYMKYLKGAYPYLFSLAVRTNPFDEKSSITVES